MNFTEELAQTIRYNRKLCGLSQLALANLAGVGKTVVYQVEKGKASTQLNSLLPILAALNIKLTIDAPFTRSEQP